MTIAERLEEVRGEIADAAVSSGRVADDVELVAVSKTWPFAPIAEAFAAGQRVFGENKVQEIEEKAAHFPDDYRWHLIGHLQKNKVRKVLPLCSLIHSIDSQDLAERVDRIAADLGAKSRVLLQVNVANDDAKFGFPVKVIEEKIEMILELGHLEVSGLMTVPSFDPDPEKVRPCFAKLREVRDSLEGSTGASLPELSMGMSHDFKVAIEEGATLVRVGSSIFGKRDYS